VPRRLSLLLALVLAACDRSHHGHHGHGHQDAPGAAPSADPLTEVARVHGGAGPWAVAGYRMGQFALKKLGLDRQSFDLDVTHRGPLEPQYACVADGAAAATGASLGKVNLRLEEAPIDGVLTIYTRKSSGQSVKLRPTEAFKKRFLNVPRPELAKAGAQVLTLQDDEIFEEVK
jgi:formylmethanofuran dehydrogenase subunit E